MTTALILATFGLGLARVIGCKSQSYQAIAHVYVGAALGVGFAAPSRDCLISAILLTILETIFFIPVLVRKFKGHP